MIGRHQSEARRIHSTWRRRSARRIGRADRHRRCPRVGPERRSDLPIRASGPRSHPNALPSQPSGPRSHPNALPIRASGSTSRANGLTDLRCDPIRPEGGHGRRQPSRRTDHRSAGPCPSDAADHRPLHLALDSSRTSPAHAGHLGRRHPLHHAGPPTIQHNHASGARRHGRGVTGPLAELVRIGPKRTGGLRRHRSPPVKEIRRRPTLPGRLRPSTIGAGGLNFRVRDGNGCDPSAIATETLHIGRRRGGRLCRTRSHAPENCIASTSQNRSSVVVLRTCVVMTKKTQALGLLVPVS